METEALKNIEAATDSPKKGLPLPNKFFDPLSADVMDDRILSFATKFPPSVAIESVYKKLPQSTHDPDSLARPIAEILTSLTAKVAFLRPGKGRAFCPYRKHFQLMF